MTDQEHAKAIFDARKAFNDACKAARDAGLRVDTTLFDVAILSLGYSAAHLNVTVTKELTGK
jgi:hypothetical protein